MDGIDTETRLQVWIRNWMNKWLNTYHPDLAWYFSTAVRPSLTACLANSPGSKSFVAVSIYRDVIVFRLIIWSNPWDVCPTFCKISYINPFITYMPFFEIPRSGWTVFKTLWMYIRKLGYLLSLRLFLVFWPGTLVLLFWLAATSTEVPLCMGGFLYFLGTDDMEWLLLLLLLKRMIIIINLKKFKIKKKKHWQFWVLNIVSLKSRQS